MKEKMEITGDERTTITKFCQISTFIRRNLEEKPQNSTAASSADLTAHYQPRRRRTVTVVTTPPAEDGHRGNYTSSRGHGTTARMSSSASSHEEFLPGPLEVEHVSEASTCLVRLSSSSSAAETVQEQRSQGPVERWQRDSQWEDDLIENELLIALVQERDPLWDTRDPLHPHNVTLWRLWNEVAKELWDGWDNTPTRVRSAFVAKVKTRWRSIKDRFNKDLRQESRVPSGSGARIRTYKYHRVLAFLRPVLAQRATWSTTVVPGSGAVLHPTAADPSQPSSNAAASGHHYSASTMPSAVVHTTVTTAAPAWTSSTDTTMQQDPGMAFRTATTTMQQDPGMAFRTATTTMQQDAGMAFRTAPTTMQQDPGMSFRTATTTMQQDPGMAFRSTRAMDSGMAARSTSAMDSGMAARSTSTMDSGMAAHPTSAMDSGMAARSTSTMDSGMAARSTSAMDSGMHGNQGKHRVTKRGPALSYRMFTLVTSEDIAGSIRFLVVKDIHLFSQKIILKRLHYKNSPKAIFETVEEREALEALESLAIVTADIEKLSEERNRKFNLTRDQQKALKEMQEWLDVVFKAADKGGNLIIWPTVLYEEQAERLLNDTSCYRRLPSNPLPAYQMELIKILDEAFAKGIIPKQLLDTVQKMVPKLPTFYLIPKVHKNPENPPGRPIVAGNEGLCEIICDTLEHFLRPLVISLPSYNKNTTSALKRLDNLCLSESMLMVTADVESLHTSIKHDDGLAARVTSNLESELIDLLLVLLKFILTYNCFMFNKRVYLQKQGTAMGASCAPSYANLFLVAWEREIFISNPIPGY
ncbi:unnamed protein product [Ranitomeya imitator]|uniref:MADF domain-containing protein n=1 Tax=Ranitomeya imitator TaxID=111125 RepID=A0ABN9LIA2_9NEOB|nr:unnamed protein product [Ranitomeya imitator]